ncbi:MAG TPA: hypothetical protein ENH85_16025 [Candidatus Scalindua sp.]|nr:hypothetical protein [Candidatus Scalindua sp.]
MKKKVKIERTRKFRFLRFTKFTFWMIIVLIVLSIPLVFYLDCMGMIESPTGNNTFSDTMYSYGLTFIFSIIGFLIAVIIFLMQYIGSKYHSEELERLPIFLKYFITTLVVLFVYIMFNFFALFLKLTYPYTLISLIFSISLIGIILTTIVFVYYNTKVSIILGMISERITNFIKKEKTFRKLPIFNEIAYTEEFTESLNRKVSIFIKNSIGAINSNQDTIFRSSLECLEEIVHHYLEQSKHIQATEDKFLSELNDQFNFIISESLKSYNQKILEDVAKTMGVISLDIIKYRKGIAEVNNFALNWLATLKDLFIRSYTKDRTIVCHICLERINDVILLILDKGYYRSYDAYKMSIDEISEILSKVDQHWSAILLQKALLMYQHQFLKFLELSKTNKIAFSGTLLRHYFDKLAKIINEAKNTHQSSINNAIIFASLYGLDSFAQKIAKLGLTNLEEDETRRNIAAHIKEFIEFNKEIIDVNPERNDNSVYDSFTESLFLITKYVDLTENDRKLLIETLSNNLIKYIKKGYISGTTNHNRPSELREATIDYFALLIYLYQDKPEIINEVIHQLTNVYDIVKGKATNKDQQGIIESLYKELKLYSCWTNIFPNLRDINKPLIKLLKKDFYEPSFPGRISSPSLFEKYGYSENRISRSGLWYLNASYMWGSRFQEEISDKLNGEKGELYIKFHEMLKK